jgi:hypothetical protein
MVRPKKLQHPVDTDVLECDQKAYAYPAENRECDPSQH